jgi:hypothetical protein
MAASRSTRGLRWASAASSVGLLIHAPNAVDACLPPTIRPLSAARQTRGLRDDSDDAAVLHGDHRARAALLARDLAVS